ncbi:MAG: AmmeMemoRadiSam system protein A [Calditrichaeota bacterium]|nr:MAG: AmmeMemoRadiSam system protein A [Calditrichota bacterium]
MFGKRRADSLSKEDQQTLLKLAREAIEARLRGEPIPVVETDSPRLREHRGVFVTLKVDHHLRGCIGMLNADRPLVETVGEIAAAAAFQDPRFPPLSPDELPQVSIEISVLAPLKRVSSVKKIKVRRDGLLIKKGRAQGVLLPQVASKNRWNRKTFLENACLKAGLEKDAWTEPEVEIMTFTAQVFEEKRNH